MSKVGARMMMRMEGGCQGDGKRGRRKKIEGWRRRRHGGEEMGRTIDTRVDFRYRLGRCFESRMHPWLLC